MASYIEFTLHGRNFRHYSQERIDIEIVGKNNTYWRPVKFTNLSIYKCISFRGDGKNYKMLLHRVIYYAHNPSWNIENTSTNNSIDHKVHLNGVPLDNSIDNLRVVNHLQNHFNRNVKGYKSFISSARKKGSFLQDITKEEYDKIMQDLMSSAKRVDRDILEEMKIIMKKDPSWWSKKPLWAKILFVMGAFGFGDVAVTTLLWSLKTKYSKFKNPVELWNWLNKTTGLDEGVDKLKESNVEGWFKVTYPAKYVDSGTFKNNFSITLNATQTEAVIEANDGSEEWEVKIQDNKIVQK
jgi:hypothetical protein